MNSARGIIAFAATGAGLALLAYLSGAPISLYPANSARLRLSFSARPERIEVCRTLSETELAKVPEHMRQRVSCEGVFATYLLRISVDGRSIGESVLHGAGLRHDRPLYLLRDYDVPKGEHRLQVTLTRREKTDDDAAAFAKVVVPEADTGLYAGRSQREAGERSRRARAAIPPSLTLDTVMSLTRQRVALVTFNGESRTFQLRTGSPSR